MDELTEQVNIALDRVKADNSFTEGQLAAHLTTSRMQLSRWRKGQYTKAFRAIIPITVLVNTPLPAAWAEQAVDIRILAPILAIPKIDA